MRPKRSVVKVNKSKILKLDETEIFPGERKVLQLNIGKLYDFTEMSIPVEVVRGKEDGPTLFISGAVHGDELNGVEIVRRILSRKLMSVIKGTLIAVPVVNVFGFNSRSRYLPDRRDLNRSFPGSKNGSLAARLANLFMKEIVSKSTHGIDFHTGAIHRSNLPQIRACMEDPVTKQMAQVFGVPVIINSNVRDGSLRAAARKKKKPILLFEGGEALRFDEDVIRLGVRGCFRVMESIGMLSAAQLKATKPSSIATKAYLVRGSFWVRAPHSGSLRFLKGLGARVTAGDKLAVIRDLLGKEKIPVYAEEDGIVIGITRLPLVNRGDAVFHLATFKNLGHVRRALSELDLED